MEAPTLKPISRILLSNDDGIDAIGLKILYDIAVQFSDDVWVIAPSENRSGASRSITLRQDVAIQQIGSNDIAVLAPQQIASFLVCRKFSTSHQTWCLPALITV